ncbi:unnamed protein product, partial [Mesorhabditis spiculigera]
MIRNVDISKAVDECKRYGATIASAVNADENKDILEFAIMSQVQKNEALFLGAKKVTTTTTTTTKATTTTVLKVCGYGWSVGPHGCYKYDGTLGSYDNRLAYCRGLNSYPTSVIDSEENRFVTDLARRGGAPLTFLDRRLPV